ncbi:uroporphyrinogen-III synthase [Cutibacterium sp. WCA-380-WT-3A]|uniref:Uroporphyrinogen-III synthase n=1 Tax=Cutibacterium porci TaxID=2605781 RepID=A0A7K0J4Y4_9ACTN|nr:uroporphyrinogen-III synthase [Cutibacterium porci]MSS44995.1 uroporphyrinogen-III synthase [Cutibacterium porci]
MTTNPADRIKPPVVVPRDDPHDKFVTTLKQAGYGVIHKALTRTVTLPPAEELTNSDLWRQADWLVVTSKTTVALLPDPLPNPTIKVAAVGTATASALRGRGINVDFVPNDHSGTGLVTQWPGGVANVLLPTSQLAADTVPQGLTKIGCTVNRREVYTTAAVEELPEVIAQSWPSVGAVVVTASSVGRALVKLVEPLGWRRQKLVALGKPTAGTLEELGRPADAVASSPTPQAVLEAVESLVA